ncbi:hypothetical protein [Streptomyces sp. NPDC005760]|uniref:hypothetical protein n=1 Tax=Streptomyces sp. NPDC005760 TaxID=3156718 RepID=UPI00340DEFFE
MFEDWYAKAGAFSALPQAPVVPDESGQVRTARSRWPARLARLARRGRSASAGLSTSVNTTA